MSRFLFFLSLLKVIVITGVFILFYSVRKYSNLKKCVIKVAERFCQKTPEVKNLIKIYQDPFNPYCPGGGDAKKPSKYEHNGYLVDVTDQ